MQSIMRRKGYIVEKTILRKAKEKYPNDLSVLFALKYHITSVVDSVEAEIKIYK